ncbi:MAG: hypothetical protein P9L92_04035 [Candidatus Electryonea clarkiae]|nr:hypothetical protein [Candidatus Electryonea clarkiae]MDP8286560.1 hypothetical protein [Candidatus Electryonea clarkiae]
MRNIPVSYISIIILGFLLAGILSCGCEEENEATEDSRTVGWNLWESFFLGNATGGVYGLQNNAFTQYQDIRIVFDDLTPGDPLEEELQLTFCRQSDNLVIGAPCSNILHYDTENDIFEGFLAPPVDGEWKLEMNWAGDVIYHRSYITINVQPVNPYPRVLESITGLNREIFAWIEPVAPGIGLQEFKIMAWHQANGILHYEPDSMMILSLRVYQVSTARPSAGNIDPQHIGDGMYEGTVNFDQPGDWGATLLNMETEPEDTLVTFLFDF